MLCIKDLTIRLLRTYTKRLIRFEKKIPIKSIRNFFLEKIEKLFLLLILLNKDYHWDYISPIVIATTKLRILFFTLFFLCAFFRVFFLVFKSYNPTKKHIFWNSSFESELSKTENSKISSSESLDTQLYF